MTKYAANCLLAAKISFINELANVCERAGPTSTKSAAASATTAASASPSSFPASGYGGSCFPKDVRAMAAIARTLDIQPSILDAVHEVNQRQKTVLLEKIRQHFDGRLAGVTVAVWGLAFKPGTDDVREAPSLALIDGLLGVRRGARA